jgi:predicted transposase
MAIITAKLKLYADPQQAVALRATQFAYRDALNYVSQYAFAHGKISSATKLHKLLYRDIRKRFGLLGQMACAVNRQVAGTYEAIWTKLRQNAAHRKAGLTKKRYRGFDQVPKYVAPTVTYSNQQFRFLAGQQVSVTTLQGRVIVRYAGYCKHLDLIQQGARIGGARLWYDDAHKTFYLLVSLEVAVPEPDSARQTTVVGVDVGRRYLAVTATLDGQAQFYPGHQVRHRAEHYLRLRKRLQQKGTRSAIRRLRAVHRRESRFRLDTNHRIARRLVDAHPHALIGLESLTYVRNNTNRRHSKHHSARQRRANRWQAQ